ncbi:MAG: hypothetical protein Fur0042_02190 [Cyanophyceae cyanobacterium]
MTLGMRTRLLIQSGLGAIATAVLPTLLFPQAAAAQAQTATTFQCQSENGIPTTVARTTAGTVPIIRWTSNYFDESGWTPERRCAAVSERFQTYYNHQLLNFLTVGVMNGQNVICVATANQQPCTHLLFTLKPSENPHERLQLLANVRVRASGPLLESARTDAPNLERAAAETPYYNIGEFLRSHGTTPAARPMLPTSSSTNTPVPHPVWGE